jgi:hypothetical protein
VFHVTQSLDLLIIHCIYQAAKALKTGASGAKNK